MLCLLISLRWMPSLMKMFLMLMRAIWPTLSRKRRYGINSSGLAASPQTGHWSLEVMKYLVFCNQSVTIEIIIRKFFTLLTLFPSLSRIPFLPHSSQADPAQQGIITASWSFQLLMWVVRLIIIWGFDSIVKVIVWWLTLMVMIVIMMLHLE